MCFRPLICSLLMSSAMNNCYFLGLKLRWSCYCFLVTWTRGVDIRKKVWANTVTLLLWLNSGTLVRAIISVNWVPVPGGRTLLSRMSEKVTITYVTWRIRKLNERALLCQGNLVSYLTECKSSLPTEVCRIISSQPCLGLLSSSSSSGRKKVGLREGQFFTSTAGPTKGTLEIYIS